MADTIIVTVDQYYTRHRNRRIMNKMFNCRCGSKNWHTYSTWATYWNCRSCGRRVYALTVVMYGTPTIRRLGDD